MFFPVLQRDSSRLATVVSRYELTKHRKPMISANSLLLTQFTNFRDAPEGCPYTQDGKWSIPLPPKDSLCIPEPAVNAVRDFVSIFMPDFVDVPFHSTKLCWYTDSLDNSFVVSIPFAQSCLFLPLTQTRTRSTMFPHTPITPSLFAPAAAATVPNSSRFWAK